MKKYILFYFLIIGNFIFLNLNAQFKETYFYDTEIKAGGKVYDHLKRNDNIIIGGKAFHNFISMPAIACFDTLGNMLWSTTSYDTSTYPNGNYAIQRMIKSGDYIFATCVLDDYPWDSKELWKVDAINGSIEWKIPFSSGDYPQHIIDYDISKILIGSFSGSKAYHYVQISFIEKNSGTILSSKIVGRINGQKDHYGLAIDSQKNIYYTIFDTIYKAYSVNPDSIIWQVQHPSLEMLDFQQVYVDANDSIFLFGSRDASCQSGKVVSMCKNNGDVNWQITAQICSFEFSDMADKNGHIVVTWKGKLAGVGGVCTTRINKSTGNVVWESGYGFTGIGSPGSYSGSGAAALSLDIDDNDDVYLTGYYASPNYGPACWGILKLNGNTGDDIYERTITVDSANYDRESVGTVACVINNNPIFCGNLQTDQQPNPKTTPTFIKMDGNTGNILVRKYFFGNSQYPSATISIKNYGNDKTVVLKQVGRSVKVEMYDYTKNLLWDKTFTKEDVLFGKNLIIDDNGSIIFSAYSVEMTDTYPYYSTTTERIYVEYLDPTGSLLCEKSFYLGVNNAYPVEMLEDNNDMVFILYQKSNNMYMRTINAGMILFGEKDLGIMYQDVYSQSQTKYAVDYDASDLLVFGRENNLNKVFKIGKYPNYTTVWDTLSFMYVINYVCKLSSDNVLICGKDDDYKDILLSYNLGILDTNWARSYTAGSKIVKFVFDTDSSNVYTIGTKANGNYVEVVIRKLSSQNGYEHWSYVIPGIVKPYDEPIDIAFDKYKGQIIVTGYHAEKYHVNDDKDLFVEIIDTSGTTINSIYRSGDFDGNTMGKCVEVLYSQSVWIGGMINDSTYGRAGFIFDSDTSVITSVIDWDDNYNFSNSSIEAYPNPFTDYINIKLFVEDENSDIKIDLYDIHGKIVYSDFSKINRQGIYYMRIKADLLSGIYLLRVQVGNKVFSGKLLKKK